MAGGICYFRGKYYQAKTLNCVLSVHSVAYFSSNGSAMNLLKLGYIFFFVLCYVQVHSKNVIQFFADYVGVFQNRKKKR